MSRPAIRSNCSDPDRLPIGIALASRLRPCPEGAHEEDEDEEGRDDGDDGGDGYDGDDDNGDGDGGGDGDGDGDGDCDDGPAASALAGRAFCAEPRWTRRLCDCLYLPLACLPATTACHIACDGLRLVATDFD